MNLPNLFTLSRIPLMFLIVAMMYGEWVGAATIAFVAFVVAGVTDFLDGYYARRQNIVTNFGILMDAVADKVLMLGIMIALVDVNGLPLPDPVPAFLVLLILGREFLITGVRLVAATKGVVVSAEKAGKQKTVTQILAVGALLLAPVSRVDLAAWSGMETAALTRVFEYGGLVLFLLATLFTLTSGTKYFRKYGPLVFAADD
ncbi:MAG: CDP-diacylglycerol--glycerol-3-phosphate 3-phosphatidyltransferase [Verrucomicrobia bacterium]|nr:MAG: CDP-diacylglycerol--glycerol-3-phosphate 3-phosphatidyltransferase [Verrucomicrobiota bacterium]